MSDRAPSIVGGEAERPVTTDAGWFSRAATLARSDRTWDIAFAAAAVATFVLITFAARHVSFANDDWQFVADRRDWSLDAFMAPHNEHWVLGWAVLWKPIMAVFGLTTYQPYLLVLHLAHIVTAAGLYVVVRRCTGAFIAFAMSLVFLLLGSSSGTFLWGTLT